MEELYGSQFTILSNEFLDKYLSDTKSEYIKVYLFYLWKGCKEGYTIEETSNEIDLTENDVEMALKYWIKKKVMKKEYLVSKKSDRQNTNQASNLVDFQAKKKELINKNRKDYADIESDLLFVAEKMLGQTMSERQQAVIAKCYNDFGFDEGLIQFLLEYCANMNKRNANYMSSVASSWYEEGIRTVDAAKEFTESFQGGKTKKTKTTTKSNVINKSEYDKKLMEYMLSKKK